ncbi:MAG TPA: alpha/beta hydrolase [Bryobacteraceae bacterium]|nr:alpha/beta hydrolase [Bryobacteraceae bacterium]
MGATNREMIQAGRHSLYVERAGDGSPAVIFDAALGASSLSWALVQPAVAQETLTLSYDRAGLGRSQAGPMPRTASRIADELRTMLERAKVPPPFVLVGHSFGGMTARLFASRYLRDMAGLVLVDPPDAREWTEMSPQNRKKLHTGAWLARRGALAARLGIARAVFWMVRAGAAGPARRISTSVSGGVLKGNTDNLLVPLQKLSREIQLTAARAWVRPKFYDALASQMESLPESASDIAAVSGLGDLPLVVLTAANPSPRRFKQQEEAARLSSRGVHRVARSSGHWIPIDEPELVIDAVLDVVQQARANAR